MKIVIWGLAAGRKSTRGAAPGAFTCREYPTPQSAREATADWLHIITTEEEG